MKPIVTHNGQTLIHTPTQTPVRIGQALKDFRGDRKVIQGGTAPLNAGSTGRVLTDRGEFYPSVVNCEWVYSASAQGAQP